jgi:transporter family-2 protein
MSAGTTVAVALTAAAGIGTSVQAAVMGILGNRIGTIEALGFSTLVAGVLGVAVLLVARRSLAGVSAGLHQPLWLWAGGALSAFIVLSITVATPRIGVTAVAALLIGGQLTSAAAIDRFGWFRSDSIPLSWTRILAIVLLAAGAALSLRT